MGTLENSPGRRSGAVDRLGRVAESTARGAARVAAGTAKATVWTARVPLRVLGAIGNAMYAPPPEVRQTPKTWEEQEADRWADYREQIEADEASGAYDNNGGPWDHIHNRPADHH